MLVVMWSLFITITTIYFVSVKRLSFVYFMLKLIICSSLSYSINDIRYRLSDRVLSIPKIGTLRGLLIEYDIKPYNVNYSLINVEAFLGIQYGIYSGRFEPSKEKIEIHRQQNPTVEKMIHFGPVCPQRLWNNDSELEKYRSKTFIKYYYKNLLKFIQNQNEDNCLYMNIYQPQVQHSKELLPVLLFIHGDGFDMGTGNAFDGSIFASYTKTIVVTINFRLGPFGFLYISHENKGDYGLMDIYTALHWLKGNIEHFNGDSNRITLYGTGTGAVLSSLVVMLETVNGGTGTTKRRKPLVRRLILNDATFLSPLMTSSIDPFTTTIRDPTHYTSNFFNTLNCTHNLSSRDIYSCLTNKTRLSTSTLLSINTYVNKYYNYLNPLEEPFPFFSNGHLRHRFFQQTNTLLPEKFDVLITMFSSSLSQISSSDSTQLQTFIENMYTVSKHTIHYLIKYAYSIWNDKLKKFEFNFNKFSYHQTIVAPLLQYIEKLSKNTHTIEWQIKSNSLNYESELPYTFGYMLAPSMSVYNNSYLYANENDRIKNSKIYQKHGHYASVHYLFNHLITSLSSYSSSMINENVDYELLRAWKTLYEVANVDNYTTNTKNIITKTNNKKDHHYDYLSSQKQSLFLTDQSIWTFNTKLLVLLALTGTMLFLINVALCFLLITKRYVTDHHLKKKDYQHLNGHTPVTIAKKADTYVSSSSPSSINSNGTDPHILEMIPAPCITSYSATSTNTSSIDPLIKTTNNLNSNINTMINILQPVNVMNKKGGTMKYMDKKQQRCLAEAIV
ncbi:unnamed protein product [Didymodactylos carnosus]|uniref:Carboxylesterase type B domain-containing protein n=1 Tax=Didymodactylos carnosus TaxID=1234261 RepID=A0A814UKY3_9BILA|nr:unnamed protein product [Didymodactylos carnosus]CAF1176983.1 unnamed protein product [Didymodactylos carnosus]CAF3524504.1 unnamed protein product [Didymodactylos carnosus]CAF3941051.1 unnamed protein product [Didymodactylos carnosus]